MSDRAAVLAALSAYYAAFNTRDYAAMDELWAQKHPVACLHPGWPPLLERDLVMASWKAILANPAAPPAAWRNENILIYGEQALVICIEQIEHNLMAASNLFMKEDGAWKLICHQAGPTSGSPLAPRPSEAPVH